MLAVLWVFGIACVTVATCVTLNDANLPPGALRAPAARKLK